MIRSIIILPHMHTFAYYKHSARWWHLSSHMPGYTSMIMVSTLMIRAIYFKWVIIGGRLYLGDGDEGFDRYIAEWE